MTKHRWTFGAVAVVCLMLLSGAVQAQVISANADTYIDSVNTGTNFGNASTLRVRGASTQHFKTYIRFSLSAIPDLEEVESVTLSVGTSGANVWAGQTFFVYGLNDGNAGESWIEGNGGTDNTPAGEITWATAPANDTASTNGFTSDATLLGSFTRTASSTGYHDFTSIDLTNFIKADSNEMVTIMLSSATGAPTGITSLDTRLSSNSPPKLTIAVPEPASAGAILAAATILLSRRSRRGDSAEV